MDKDEKTLLERLSENPEAIAELSRDELTEAKTELMAAGREQSAIAKDKKASAEDRNAALAAVEEATERLSVINERLEAFDAEDAELEAKVSELEVVFEADETPEASEETEEVETPEASEEAEEEVVAEVTDEEIAEVIESETVTASKPSIGALAKRTKTKLPEPQGIVANAGPALRGDYTKFASPTDLGRGALELWKSYGKSTKVDAKAIVASFDTSSFHEHEVTGELAHDGPVIDQMLKDLRNARTPEALTAAIGICAPSQPLYDYFSIGSRDGMIQLPTLNASRGSVTYRTSPSYASVNANASWSAAAGQVYTNANAQAGASKTAFEIECPATQTCTVDAFPVILTFGNFTQRFDPETVANAIENSMIFHDHFVNGTHIASMVAASTAVNGGDTGGGGLVNVGNLVNFEASKYRDTYRMDMDAMLELVAPAWVRDALVADYVARNATVDWANARGRVASLFASLNVNVQWVQDWQSIGDAGDDGWRTAADFMLFAPGTFVRLDGGNLDLGIDRDSTLNATNQFQTFVESFEQVCEVGHDSWLLDDITICPRGSAGIDVALDCNPGFGS